MSVANRIHPSAILTGEVEIGSGNIIGPFAVISGSVRIGDDNWIGAGVVIGAPPEVRAFDLRSGNPDPHVHAVTIGNRNVIREYAQVHHGLQSPTTLGDDTFIMNQVYVAHDCAIDSEVTIASSVLLAGHVTVGAGANIGLGASVHQRVRVGALCMVGMGSVVTRSVLPLAKAYGNPARLRGANVVGMRRRGIPEDVIDWVASLYGAEHSPDDLVAALSSRSELLPYLAEWPGRG